MKKFSYTFSIPLPIEDVFRHIIFGKVSEKTPTLLKILHALNDLPPESEVTSVEILTETSNSTAIVVYFSSVKKKLWFESQIETLSEE